MIISKYIDGVGRQYHNNIRIADAASYAMVYGMLRSDGSPPEIDPELFEKTGITKEDFDKWAPEIRDDIAFTFEALGGA